MGQEGTSEEKEEGQPEEVFPFENFANLQFDFSSGAGGWATSLTINVDGSFSGEFFDGELGLTGEGYPDGTMYRCDFSGQFTQPFKVNEYTYSMQISELNYAQEVGKEEIKDGMLYCYLQRTSVNASGGWILRFCNGNISRDRIGRAE